MCPKEFGEPMNSGGGGDDTQSASWWFRYLQPDSGAAPPFVRLRYASVFAKASVFAEATPR